MIVIYSKNIWTPDHSMTTMGAELECTMCSKVFPPPSRYKAFPMCTTCYDEAEGVDMETARVLTFTPADAITTTAHGDTLFLGSEGSRASESWLAEQGIGRVLTVACASEHLPKVDGVSYKTIDVDDDPDEDLTPHLAETLSFIDGSAKTRGSRPHALVHCVSGISRSGTVVVACTMKSRGIGFDDALAFVRRERPQVHPNSGFSGQLRCYESDLRRDGAIKGPDSRSQDVPQAASSQGISGVGKGGVVKEAKEPKMPSNASGVLHGP